MTHIWFDSPKRVAPAALVTAFLLVILACGTPAATPVPEQTPTPSLDPTSTPVPGATPTSTPYVRAQLGFLQELDQRFPVPPPEPTWPPRRGGVLHLSVGAHPDLDPVRIRNSDHYLIYDQMMEWEATWYFPEVQTSPMVRNNLVEGWEMVDGDPSVWDFYVRQDVVFQDRPPANGRALTAHDIKYSYDLLSARPGYTAAATIKETEVIDDYTVRMHLNLPLSEFPLLITNGTAPVIVPREGVEAPGGLRDNPGGTGAFVLEDFVTGEGALLTKNPNYHVTLRGEQLPFVDGLRLFFVADIATQTALFTAEDVLWSIEELSQSERHPGSNVIRSIWQNPEGHAEIVDPYTIRVNTGAPVPDVFVFDRLLNPSPRSVWVASKQQSEELGAEVANRQTALTGSWGITEYRTGEFWRLQAVEDHWRKTPYFAEMVMWEIPEESSRMAGFQTGQLDTIDMNFDSIPLVESVPGSDLVRVPGAGVAGLNFYPGFYVGVGTPEQRPGYNSNLAWVSSNPDPASEEWERARLVRWALATAIDSEAIVETLLWGFGEPIGYSAEYAGHEEYLDSDMETWSFDPDRAVELLAQAGYPDGFSITLTTAIRAAPAEVEACEAVATMWGDIGIDVRFQRVPYSTLRPSLVARNNEGVTCHSNPFTISPLARASSLSTEGVFNHGAEHPFIEDIGPRMETELDPEVRRELERQFLRFLHDNALTRVGMYTFDNVWPVGPSIQSWEEHIKMGDTRVLNGMEYIRPR